MFKQLNVFPPTRSAFQNLKRISHQATQEFSVFVLTNNALVQPCCGLTSEKKMQRHSSASEKCCKSVKVLLRSFFLNNERVAFLLKISETAIDTVHENIFFQAHLRSYWHLWQVVRVYIEVNRPTAISRCFGIAGRRVLAGCWWGSERNLS